MIFKLYFIAVSAALFTLVRSSPINRDAQMCKELCANCKGTATFADDKCECDIEENGEEGAECLRRTRREVGDNGFNLISCNLVDGDERKTRCTLGSKHFRTRNSIDQVAKYFMKDGPITGSIFKAPHYSVRSKFHDCGEKSHLVGQPLDKLHRASIVKAPLYSAPPQQVIINLPQGYVPSGSPITGSGTPDVMTGSTRLIIQPHVAAAAPAEEVGTPQVITTSAEEVGSPQVITEPQEVMPEQIVGAPHIITQPTELIPPKTEPAHPPEHIEYAEPEKPAVKLVQDPEPVVDVPVADEKPKVEIPKFTIQRPPAISLGKDFATVRMVELPKTIAPLFMQSLLQHLSQPMLGIPQALQTITKAPGISQIVSAPGNLLNSLVNRLGITGSASKSKGGDGDSDDGNDDLKFSTNTDLFSHYDPDLFKLFVNPGDDFNAVLGSANPYSTSVPSHVLVHPAYTSMPVVQSPVLTDYSPYDREYISQIPAYMIGSPLEMPYFDSDDSFIPIYYDASKMEKFINEPNDPKVEMVGQGIKENPSTPMKEIFIEVPVAKPKKICKKSSKDESLKKVTRDTKAISENISHEIMDTNDKNQANVETTQTSKFLKVDKTTTQIPIIDKTPGEEKKRSMTKVKTEKTKTDISSKIKKSRGEKYLN